MVYGNVAIIKTVAFNKVVKVNYILNNFQVNDLLLPPIQVLSKTLYTS